MTKKAIFNWLTTLLKIIWDYEKNKKKIKVSVLKLK